MDQGIEKALSMYKENVSPSEERLFKILSQIPEQETHEEGRAVRSPYTWIAITQVVMVCSIIIAMMPTVLQPEYFNNPYYEVDNQVALFESHLDEEDYNATLNSYNEDSLPTSTLN